MRRDLAAKTLLWFGIAAAFALSAVATVSAADQKTLLPMVVNGQETVTALVILRGDDVLVRASDLTDSGFAVSGNRETVDGTEFVSLRSLGTSFKFHIDQVKAQLVVDAPASFFGKHEINLSLTQPQGLRYGSQRGGYLNYALSDTNGSFTTFEEAAYSNGTGVLYASASSSGTGIQRDLTSLEYDDRDRLRRTIIGDAQMPASFFSGGEFIGGITVARDSSLNPYTNTRPLIGFAGTASSPTTALIYNNGILIRTIQLPPGSFDLNNLPLPGGTANVRVVLRDAFGNTTTLTRNLYVSSGLLEKGYTDYSYSLGFVRGNLDTNGGAYGPAAAVGGYRIGVTNDLTAGGGLEAGGGIVSGGPNLTIGAPIGQFSLAAAGSSEHGQTGGAGVASYTYAGRAFGVQAGVLEQTARFARLSLDASANRVLHDASLSVSAPLARSVSMGFTVDRSAYRDTGIDNSQSVNFTAPLGRASFVLTGTSSFDAASSPQRTRSIYANVFFARPGHNTMEQFTSRTDAAGTTGEVTVEKTVGAGEGFGYLGSIAQGAEPASEISLTERAPFGIASFDRVASSATSFTDLSFSGSLASLGTGVLFGRPIIGAFAVVQTPAVSGLPVYLGGNYQGTTDRYGRLLVPELAPNFENSVSIDAHALPIDVDVKQTKELIAPFENTGLLVVYGTHQVRAITGRVRIVRGTDVSIPELSEMVIRLPGGPVAQGLGGEGTFYFEEIPGGSYKAHVSDERGGCDFTIVVPPARSAAVTNLGTLTCEAR